MGGPLCRSHGLGGSSETGSRSLLEDGGGKPELSQASHWGYGLLSRRRCEGFCYR